MPVGRTLSFCGRDIRNRQRDCSFLSQAPAGSNEAICTYSAWRRLNIGWLAEARTRDEGSLIAAVVALTNNQPQVGALFDWETRVLGAAGTYSVHRLAGRGSAASVRQRWKNPVITRNRGCGQGAPRRRSLSGGERRYPVLADRISNSRSFARFAIAVWQRLWVPRQQQLLTNEVAAGLNRMIHVDISDKDSSGRGADITLPLRLKQDFDSCQYGLDETTAARNSTAASR